LCDQESVNVEALITTTHQLELMNQIEPDLAIAAGFGEILSAETLSIPKRGCINIHPGYLPDTRGYNPNVWSIVEGLPAGATIHYMNENIDEGDIIARTKVEKHFTDDGKSLQKRIEEAAVDLFINNWSQIESGDIDPIEQDEDQATYHVKQDFIDLCEINPEKEYKAKELIDILRALTYPPFDNAFMEIDGETYNIEIEIRESNKESVKEGFTSSY
jgi:methionyl-tRNA formyltransferase